MRELASLVLGVVVALSACSKSSADGGGNPPPNGGGGETNYKSGSRLRAVVIGADPGPVAFQRFHDTQLDTDCVFEPSADGAQHCVPYGVTPGASVYFADSSCTTRVASIASGCAAPKYVASATSCPWTARVYPVGAKASASELFVSDSSGACRSAGAPSGDLYALGAELPASAFVGATEQRRQGSARLDVSWLVGEDGSEVFYEFHDKQIDVDCQFTSGDVGMGRDVCHPPSPWYTHGSFADAACTATPLAVRSAGTCPTDPLFADVATLEACGLHTTAFARVGAIFSGTVYAPTTSGACQASTSTGADVHSLGETFPIDGLPHVEDAHTTGTGRLQQQQRVAQTGETLLTLGLYDAQLDIACFAAQTSDGKLRCVPNGDTNGTGYQGIVYADGACTQAMVRQSAAAGCTVGALPAYVSRSLPQAGSPSCPSDPVFAAWKVGAATSVATYYARAGSSCTPNMAAARDVFTTLTPIDPATLVELSRRTE